MEKYNIDKERIYRYFSGKYSKKDASYISEVFCDNTHIEALKSFLSKQFNELSPDDKLHEKNLDHILYKIHYDINVKNQRSRSIDRLIKWSLRIAGIVVFPLLILFALYTLRTRQANMDYLVKVEAPAWTRTQFNLPDSTTVWLNSGSIIEYKGDFNENRQVTLTGEAFFDVTEAKERPFIVMTHDISIKVLGTSFNVAAYDNEKEIEVVLEEGELEFTDFEYNKSYTMKPNDLVVYDRINKELSTDTVEPQKYSSWTQGKLIFRNDPIDVIARRLERWYNIDVEVDFTSSEDIRWRATFIDEDLEEVLIFLENSLPVVYRIENGNLRSDSIYNKKKVIISRKTE